MTVKNWIKLLKAIEGDMLARYEILRPSYFGENSNNMCRSNTFTRMSVSLLTVGLKTSTSKSFLVIRRNGHVERNTYIKYSNFVDTSYNSIYIDNY